MRACIPAQLHVVTWQWKPRPLLTYKLEVRANELKTARQRHFKVFFFSFFFFLLFLPDPVLSLLVEPERASVMEGETVSVSCSVQCLCPEVTPVWRREGNVTLSDLATVSYNCVLICLLIVCHTSLIRTGS